MMISIKKELKSLSKPKLLELRSLLKIVQLLSISVRSLLLFLTTKPLREKMRTLDMPLVSNKSLDKDNKATFIRVTVLSPNGNKNAMLRAQESTSWTKRERLSLTGPTLLTTSCRSEPSKLRKLPLRLMLLKLISPS